MKLKICGMKYPENIIEVSSLLPDYMGFIFWGKSTRCVEGFIPLLPKSIQKVGVFVDATIAEILSKIKQYDLDAIQLHGNEDVDFCKNLKSDNIEIIKVFSIHNMFNFNQLAAFEKHCDYFLFDTKGKLPGGNGLTFDWDILKNYPSKKPFFLSGGIGMDELDRIKNLNLPLYAIDVNSKFEIEPGLKNTILLKTFQKKIQNELSR